MRALAFIPAVLVATSMALPADEPPKKPRHWDTGPRGKDLLLVGAMYSAGDLNLHEELHGVTLSAGLWDEEGDFPGRILYWAYLGRTSERDYASIGANLGFSLAPMGPVRIVPALKLGAGYEWSGPAVGFEALPGIGLEVAWWLASKYQVALGIDRDFGAHSGTRNVIGFSVRWSPKQW